MTTWFVDSSVLIDALRKDARARQVMDAAREDGGPIWSSAIVRTEVIMGARPEDGPSMHSIFGELLWQQIDIDVADLAGRMAVHFRRTHPGISVADYVIAAGSQLLGARLLTLNVKHFPMFPDLEPAYR